MPPGLCVWASERQPRAGPEGGPAALRAFQLDAQHLPSPTGMLGDAKDFCTNNLLKTVSVSQLILRWFWVGDGPRSRAGPSRVVRRLRDLRALQRDQNRNRTGLERGLTQAGVEPARGLRGGTWGSEKLNNPVKSQSRCMAQQSGPRSPQDFEIWQAFCTWAMPQFGPANATLSAQKPHMAGLELSRWAVQLPSTTPSFKGSLLTLLFHSPKYRSPVLLVSHSKPTTPTE
ncbi:uncharacterized protein LOC111096078 isoform X1 [Canis lupus familiaris]|uniref:uncharacterized protein LOC111096078 isoform X1 n=1 Tax=Canis lupus familiaris TaxID=9615 RepID=UPI0018F7D82C|nr:uncharacterized protein LOC111096078 isoform X1 [Canis lupus familiaris]